MRERAGRCWVVLAAAGILAGACSSSSRSSADVGRIASSTVNAPSSTAPAGTTPPAPASTTTAPPAPTNVDVSALADATIAGVDPSLVPPLAIDGAAPVGPIMRIEGTVPTEGVTIGVPVSDASAGNDVAAAFLDQATGQWVVEGGVFDAGSSRVYVHTMHLSVWRAISVPGWNLIASARDAIVHLAGFGDRGDAPTCEGQVLPVEVTALTLMGAPSGEVFKLDGCAQVEGAGGYRIKLVNRRPVAVRIKVTGGDAQVDTVTIPGTGDLIAIGIDKLGRVLGQPAFGGMLVAAGGSIELVTSGPVTLSGEVDNAGTAWSVILSAVSANGSAGVDALIAVFDSWDLSANAASGDWKAISAQAIEKLYGELISKGAVQGTLRSVLGKFSGSLVVAVRGAIEGAVAPWFGNVGATVTFTPPIDTGAGTSADDGAFGVLVECSWDDVRALPIDDVVMDRACSGAWMVLKLWVGHQWVQLDVVDLSAAPTIVGTFGGPDTTPSQAGYGFTSLRALGVSAPEARALAEAIG